MRHVVLLAQAVVPPSSFTPGVHLASDFNTLWGSISKTTGFATFQWLLTVVGLLLVLSSVLTYVWKRRSGQGDHKHVFTTLIVGAVLLAPTVLVPFLLTIADVIINAIVSVFK